MKKYIQIASSPFWLLLFMIESAEAVRMNAKNIKPIMVFSKKSLSPNFIIKEYGKANIEYKIKSWGNGKQDTAVPKVSLHNDKLPQKRKVLSKTRSSISRSSILPFSRKTIVDELINREVKSLLQNISSDSVKRKELLSKARTLLKYKSQLEVSEILKKEENQFDGFYLGAGLANKKVGQSLSSEQGQQHFNFEHKIPIGDSFIVRLHNPHGGAGHIGPDDLVDTISEIPNMIVSPCGNVQNVVLMKENGVAPDANDFYEGVGASPFSAALVEIRNDNYLIKADLDVKSENVSIDERKNQIAGVAVIGFGKTFFDHLYVGLELMSDIKKDFVSEKQGMQIKTIGINPISALRLGFLYDGWLAYAKVGAVYSRTIANGNQRFGKFVPLIGGGIEKAFGNSFSLRLDADYVRGSSYNFEKTDNYSLTYKKGTTDYTGAGIGRVGQVRDFTYTTAVKRPINLKRKGGYNIRLILSYHMRTI
ncbi:MAG: hypothetical protein LBS23_03825 [Holosporaceae bacterium]|nr:hypothetical protein [Holosporaceae bacterium]